MPRLRVAYDRLKWELEHGNGEEIVHVSFVEREQKERIKNNKRVTRFVLPCDDPDLCSRLNAHKNRIFRKVKDKSLMLSLMEKAWEQALADTELDKILAALDGPNV